MQKEWIGQKSGAKVRFELLPIGNSAVSITFYDYLSAQDVETLQVFTTRPDTIFGVSYLVLAPENVKSTILGTAI